MSGWTWPNGLLTIPQVTGEYGMRTHPIYGTQSMHWGIDLWIPDYTNRSAADGEVIFAASNYGAGNEVRVKHPGGTVTKYKHNEYFAAGIGVGAQVKRGQPLGRMGTTGDSTGDHLHFETLMTATSSAMDPRVFMAARIAEGGGTAPAGGTEAPIPSPIEREIMTTLFTIMDDRAKPYSGDVLKFTDGKCQYISTGEQIAVLVEDGAVQVTGTLDDLVHQILAHMGPGVSNDSVMKARTAPNGIVLSPWRQQPGTVGGPGGPVVLAQSDVDRIVKAVNDDAAKRLQA